MSKPSRKKQKSFSKKQEQISKLLEYGSKFHVARQTQLAEDAYRKVIDLDPLNFRALYLLAILFSEAGKYKEAVEFMNLSLKINPQYSLAHNDLGVIYQQLGDVKNAMLCYEKALSLNKNFYEAHNNMGVAMQSKGNAKKAREHFKHSLSINPYYFDASNNHIFALDMSTEETVQSLIDVRKKWAETHETPLLSKHKPHDNELSIQRKLRVGYVSADFRLHSASFVFGAMLIEYNRDKFDVVAFNNSHTPPDNRTLAFKESVTEWHDVYGMSDDDLSTLIRKCKIDILVDLSGYSAGSRLLTFARKPAPIQACAWGYATSTGLKSMDYFLADNVVVPENERDLYVEDVVYLPNVVNHFCPERKPDVGPLPCLKTRTITFGSFNRLGKISDETFALWARVMKVVTNSRFLFKINEADPNSAKDRIVSIMSSHGIEPNRLWFSGKTSWMDHMNAFNDVDIALDPFPHTGGLTTIDCLVMGVPVVTLRWPTIVGRLSASMLHTMGMDDWIAETEDQYIDIIVQKLSDIENLSKLRATMRDKFYTTALGDCKFYCQSVETEYVKMWEKYVSKQTT